MSLSAKFDPLMGTDSEPHGSPRVLPAQTARFAQVLTTSGRHLLGTSYQKHYRCASSPANGPTGTHGTGLGELLKTLSARIRACLAVLAGIALVGAGVATGVAPASAADPVPNWWLVTGTLSPVSVNGSGTIPHHVPLGVTVAYTDPRCVPISVSYHPNGVVTTTIGASTYTSPPLSQWTTTSDSDAGRRATPPPAIRSRACQEHAPAPTATGHWTLPANWPVWP